VAFQAVPDTAQCKFTVTGDPSTNLGGSNAQFSLYVRNTIDPWSQTRIDVLLTEVTDWWNTEIDPLLATGWVRTSILVTDIGASNGNQAEDTTSNAGARAGGLLSPQVAVLVRFRGDSGGEPLQGRVYAPLGTESDVDGNGFVGTFAADVLAAFQAFETYLGTSEAQVIVSRYSGMAAPTVPIKVATRRAGDAETNTLQAISIGPTVASQRRRRRAPY
jgi:hypothetical protein